MWGEKTLNAYKKVEKVFKKAILCVVKLTKH